MNIIERKQLEKKIKILIEVDVEKAMVLYTRNAGNLLPNRTFNTLVNKYNEHIKNEIIDMADKNIEKAIVLYHRYNFRDKELLEDLMEIKNEQGLERIKKLMVKNRTKALKLYIKMRMNDIRVITYLLS